jgi:hypothetical protein
LHRLRQRARRHVDARQTRHDVRDHRARRSSSSSAIARRRVGTERRIRRIGRTSTTTST